MAIYRFEAKVISRSGARSAVASAAYRTGKCATSAAAYRAGAKLTDERTGETYDFTNKPGVLGAEIMTPEGAPAWMQDRSKLWNTVEKIEKRKDAQLARDFIISLPHELTHEQRVALTREFVQEQFVNKGYVADIAWHSPDKEDSLNHHAHVMVPLRKVNENGFSAKKERPPDGQHPMKAWKAELGHLREEWAHTANRHLERYGHEARIDHRTLEAQGIDREPEPKMGPLATQIEREGRESLAGNARREVKARNQERDDIKRVIQLTEMFEAKLEEKERKKERGDRDEHDPTWTSTASMVSQQDSARAMVRRHAEDDGWLWDKRQQTWRADVKARFGNADMNKEMTDKKRVKPPRVKATKERSVIEQERDMSPDIGRSRERERD
jgi:hypothetical protein